MGIIPYKEKLKWILTSCEAVHTLKGSAILSQIYSYVIYLGNEKFLNKILNEVTKPFIEFILNWIKYGEIKDPYDVFFVNINEEIKDENIWKNKYKLILVNIPNFVKREFVLKIFEVGKCIHFIKNFCKEKYNLNNVKKVIQFIKNKYFNEKEKENNINFNIIEKSHNIINEICLNKNKKIFGISKGSLFKIEKMKQRNFRDNIKTRLFLINIDNSENKKNINQFENLLNVNSNNTSISLGNKKENESDILV